MKVSESDQRLADWKLRLLEQARSGLSQSEFCRQKGLSDKAFYYWMRKIKKTDAPAPKPPQFIEVKNPAVNRPIANTCRLIFPGSLTIEIPVGADIRWVSTLISGLKSK